MPDCTSIDSLITPYVDGNIGAPERRLVDEHVRRCPPCYSRVSAERAVFELMRTRRDELASVTASPALRDRCEALRRLSSAAAAGAGAAKAWRTRLAPLAVAAGVVAAAGAASIYLLTERSSSLLAAELTADDVKCFALNGALHTHDDAPTVESSMLSGFGWQMHLPAQGVFLIGPPFGSTAAISDHRPYRDSLFQDGSNFLSARLNAKPSDWDTLTCLPCAGRAAVPGSRSIIFCII